MSVPPQHQLVSASLPPSQFDQQQNQQKGSEKRHHQLHLTTAEFEQWREQRLSAVPTLLRSPFDFLFVSIVNPTDSYEHVVRKMIFAAAFTAHVFGYGMSGYYAYRATESEYSESRAALIVVAVNTAAVCFFIFCMYLYVRWTREASSSLTSLLLIVVLINGIIAALCVPHYPAWAAAFATIEACVMVRSEWFGVQCMLAALNFFISFYNIMFLNVGEWTLLAIPKPHQGPAGETLFLTMMGVGISTFIAGSVYLHYVEYERLSDRSSVTTGLGWRIAHLLRTWDLRRVDRSLKRYESTPDSDSTLLSQLTTVLKTVRDYGVFLPRDVVMDMRHAASQEAAATRQQQRQQLQQQHQKQKQPPINVEQHQTTAAVRAADSINNMMGDSVDGAAIPVPRQDTAVDLAGQAKAAAEQHQHPAESQNTVAKPIKNKQQTTSSSAAAAAATNYFKNHIHNSNINHNATATAMATLSTSRPLLQHVQLVWVEIAKFAVLEESVSPDELSALLRVYHTAVSRLIRLHLGVVVRNTSASVCGMWNAPLLHKHGACQALFAAMHIVAVAAEELNLKFEEEGFGLSLRVGVHGGPCFVGPVGSGRRCSYAVNGSTVRIAQQLAKFGNSYLHLQQQQQSSSLTGSSSSHSKQQQHKHNNAASSSATTTSSSSSSMSHAPRHSSIYVSDSLLSDARRQLPRFVEDLLPQRSASNAATAATAAATGSGGGFGASAPPSALSFVSRVAVTLEIPVVQVEETTATAATTTTAGSNNNHQNHQHASSSPHLHHQNLHHRSSDDDGAGTTSNDDEDETTTSKDNSSAALGSNRPMTAAATSPASSFLMSAHQLIGLSLDNTPASRLSPLLSTAKTLPGALLLTRFFACSRDECELVLNPLEAAREAIEQQEWAAALAHLEHIKSHVIDDEDEALRLQSGIPNAVDGRNNTKGSGDAQNNDDDSTQQQQQQPTFTLRLLPQALRRCDVDAGLIEAMLKMCQRNVQKSPKAFDPVWRLTHQDL